MIKKGKTIFHPKFFLQTIPMETKCLKVREVQGGGGQNRSISMGQNDRLVPEGLRGSGVCLGVTENDVFLCFLWYSDSHWRPDTRVKVYA